MSGLLAGAAGREVEPDGVELRRLKAEGRSAGADRARVGPEEPRVRSGGGRPAVRLLPLRADRLSAGGRVAAGAGARFVRSVREELPLQGREDRPLTVAGNARAVQAPAVAPPRSGDEGTAVVSGLSHPRARAGGADEGAVHGLLPASPRAQADGRGVRCRPSAARGSAAASVVRALHGRSLPAVGDERPRFCQVCYRRWKKIPVANRAVGAGGVPGGTVRGSRRLTAGGP